MLFSLKEISNLYTHDLAPIRLIDVLFDSGTEKVDRLVCQYGLFPFSHEILVETSSIGGAQDLFRGALFQINMSRDELKAAHERSQIETFFDQARKNFSSRAGFENQFEFVLDVKSHQREINSVQEGSSSRLLSYKGLKEFFVESSDQVFGQFYDLVVDSIDWRIRYLVVNTAAGFSKNLKAIPYHLLDKVGWISGVLLINLSGKPFERPLDYPGSIFVDLEEGFQQTKKASGSDVFFPGEFL